MPIDEKDGKTLPRFARIVLEDSTGVQVDFAASPPNVALSDNTNISLQGMIAPATQLVTPTLDDPQEVLTETFEEITNIFQEREFADGKTIVDDQATPLTIQGTAASTATAPTVITLTLAAAAISDALAANAPVGDLTSNGDPATYTIVTDADDKFQIVGTQLQLKNTVDFTVSQFHSVTVRAENAAGSVDRTFTLEVATPLAIVGIPEVFVPVRGTATEFAHDLSSAVTGSNPLTVPEANAGAGYEVTDRLEMLIDEETERASQTVSVVFQNVLGSVTVPVAFTVRQELNTTLGFRSDLIRKDYSPAPALALDLSTAVGAQWSTEDFTFIMTYYEDGTSGNTGQAKAQDGWFNFSVINNTGGRHVGFSYQYGPYGMSMRPDNTNPQRGMRANRVLNTEGDAFPSAQDPATVGWRTVAWRVYREPTQNPNDKNRDIQYFRDDLAANIQDQMRTTSNGTSLNGTRYSFGEVQRLEIQDEFAASIMDIGMVYGDTTALFAWIRANPQRSITEFNFAANGMTPHIWPLQKADPGAPLSIETFDIANDQVWLERSDGENTPWTVTTKDPFWSNIAAYQQPPVPVYAVEPTLTVAGNTATVTIGEATGAPEPLLQGLARVGHVYLDGVDVSASGTLSGTLEAGTNQATFTVPDAHGQIVAHTLYQASPGAPHTFRVLDQWIEPTGFAGLSGNDNAIEYTMSGVAVDGFYFQFAAPSKVYRMNNGRIKVEPGTQIVSTWPESQVNNDGNSIHGMMLNPRTAVGADSGWDSRIKNTNPNLAIYDAALNVTLPYTMQDGDCLIKSISNMVATTDKALTDKYVPLHCTAGVPKHDEFAPSYVQNVAGNFVGIRGARIADLEARLQTLPALDSTGIDLPTDINDCLDKLKRLRFDIAENWNRDWQQCSNFHAGVYGRDLNIQTETLFGPLMSDFKIADPTARANAKREYVVALVQQGLDAYSTYKTTWDDHGRVMWKADGGHNLGRKALILFAGYMLNNADMLGIMAGKDADVRDLAFQEDLMTFNVTQAEIDISNGPIGPDASSDLWRPSYGSDDATRRASFEQGMLGTVWWRGTEIVKNCNAMFAAHPYQISTNHDTHHGTVLMIQALGLVTQWGHDPFIDYHYKHIGYSLGITDPFMRRDGAVDLYTRHEVRNTFIPNMVKFDGTMAYRLLRTHYDVGVWRAGFSY